MDIEQSTLIWIARIVFAVLTASINVMARPGRVFDNMQIFKVMHELGFHYSENRVFEYFVPDSKYIAFSIIDIRKPHYFPEDPQAMRSTNGLVAIMQLPIADGDGQVNYFHLLLSVLDENLDAELCDRRRNPLKSQHLYAMQKEIELFEQSYTSKIQHDYQTHND